MIINPLESQIKEDDSLSIYNLSFDINKVVTYITKYLLENNLDLLEKTNLSPEENETIKNIIKEKVYKKFTNFNFDINDVIKQVFNRLFGYYILQKYIDNINISDIRVTKWDSIFVMEKGSWKKVEEKFVDKEDYLNFVRYCVLKNRGMISEEKPVVTVSDKKYHLRIEAGISPVNPISASLVIRIHRPYIFEDMKNLLIGEVHMMNLEMYCFILKAIIAGCNIIISGKGASGKTTLLRAMVNKIPDNITITSNEETVELFSNHKNIIQREIVINRDEDKNITLEKLMAQSLLMTNDMIIIGEMKGAEAMSFLDAVATGHRGYATLHSDSAVSTLDRLITLMKRDPKAIYYTEGYLRQILGQSIDLIIYMKNFKIVEIAEVIKIEENDVKVKLLYKFEIEQILERSMQGFFKKMDKPSKYLKEKFDRSSMEFEKIYGGS